MAKKKKKMKWNRANYFSRKKSTKNQVGHPLFVYGTRGSFRKYLVFTHTPEKGKESDYQELKHNIDPDEKDEKSYVKKRHETSKKDSLREPDKKYRIHEEDRETIKKLKK